MEDRNPRIQTLFGGPIDVVGDVQGELGLLQSLLQQLGYDSRTAVHPEGRRLVFVGDLVDRGPDSANVLECVMGWMTEGRAQCILGNHELDILRGKERPEENGWFFAEAGDTRRETWRAFMDALPVALEREDLRVVHACWDDASLEWLKSRQLTDGYRALHIAGIGRAEEAVLRRGSDRLTDGQREALMQNENPIKVVTSGREIPTLAPKVIGGSLHHTDQERWWDRYSHPVPVVIGHYRRAPAGVESRSLSGKWDYVFDEYAPYAWLGPQRKAFCVDYSGQGYQKPGQPGEVPLRLAALRWPECELVFDDGERVAARATAEQHGGVVA
jgi:hypothetical protein